MPIDFDESEMQESEALDQFVEAIMPQQAPPQTARRVEVQEPAEASSYAKTMSEVERRLELAKYYRVLLDDQLFGDASPVARQVEEEVRGFVQTRLRVLLNIEGGEVKPVKFPFTDNEVLVLKSVAKTILNKDGAPKPQRATAVAPPPPAGETTILEPYRRPEAPKRPYIKRRTLEENPPPEVKRAQPERETPAPASTPQPAQKKKLAIGDVFKEGGRTYELVLVDGKPFPKDITKQASSTRNKPLPMPQGEAFTAAVTAKAAVEAQMVSQAVAASPSGALVNQALSQVRHQEDGIQLNQ